MKRDLTKRYRSPAADFLRVFSLAVVAWYHFWQQSWLNPNFTVFGLEIDIYPMIRVGYMFVYNLILISGFALTLSALGGAYKSAKQFYKRRLIRILPSYLFCIAVFLIISSLPGGVYDGYGGQEHRLKDVIAHLTFTHNLFYETYVGTGLNAALWTVAVEMQFYLLFPLIFFCFKKRPLITYAVMTLIAFAYRIYASEFIPDTRLFINRLPAMTDVFANGMLAAKILCKLKKKKINALWGTIYLILLAASVYGMYLISREISYISGDEAQRIAQLWGSIPFSLCAAVFLISGSLGFAPIRALLSNPPIRFLGGISYNFYMWHQPVSVWLKQLRIPPYTEEYPNMAGNAEWQKSYMIACVMFSIIVAIRTTYLIEKPCAKLLKRPLIAEAKTAIKGWRTKRKRPPLEK